MNWGYEAVAAYVCMVQGRGVLNSSEGTARLVTSRVTVTCAQGEMKCTQQQGGSAYRGVVQEAGYEGMLGVWDVGLSKER